MTNTQRILEKNYNMSYFLFLDNVKILNSQLSINMFNNLSLKQLIDLKVDYSLVCCELKEVKNSKRYIEKIEYFANQSEYYFQNKLQLITQKINQILA